MDRPGAEIALVALCVPLICGAILWLWHLARNSLQGRLLIIALWLVLAAMSLISGPPFPIVMGCAAMMMGMLFWAVHTTPWR